MSKPGWVPSKAYNEALGALYGSGTVTPRVEKKTSPDRPSEYQEQVWLVDWAKERGLFMLSIPNAGKRSYWQGQKEVAMGLYKGAADLFLAMPRCGFNGYFIEMKSRGQKPRPEQVAFLERARGEGFKAEWFDDWEKARDSVMDYLQVY